MGINTDRPVMRSIGSLVGVGFVAVGAYALSGADGPLPVVAAERVFWYGATALGIGLLALVGSWIVRDPDSIWCGHPPRWGRIWAGPALRRGPKPRFGPRAGVAGASVSA